MDEKKEISTENTENTEKEVVSRNFIEMIIDKDIEEGRCKQGGSRECPKSVT